ncbi:MAG: hypothetical protein CMH98_19040 [Oceanospirillaceae bacterium]|nr:hypothetical protein [Oceanospirillaceae bacterium]
MDLKVHKWLVYTAIAGLIPMFCRLVIYYVYDGGDIKMVSPSDIVAFGIILHLSTLNELEHWDEKSPWKTWANGFAFTFGFMYTVIFSFVVIGEAGAKLNDDNMIKLLTFLAAISFIFCASFSYRSSKPNVKNRLRETEEA